MKVCMLCDTSVENGKLECPNCGFGRFRVTTSEQETDIPLKPEKKPSAGGNVFTPLPYDVTVIHAGEDYEAAAQIVSELKNRGLIIWVDPVPIAKRFTPATSVVNAILGSKLILYICSKATATSIWCDIENVEFFRTLPRNRKLHILPVLIEQAEIPPGLTKYAHFDLSLGLTETRLNQLTNEIKKRIRKREVFISYSSKDKVEVRRIVNELQKLQEINLWFDEETLSAGSILRREIEQGIADADYLLAVFSTHAIDTIKGWIGFELDQAYDRERERNKLDHYFVIPVKIDDTISFPGWLGTKVYVDMTKDFNEGIEDIKKAIAKPVPV